MRSLACVAYCLCLVLAVAKAASGYGTEVEFWCPEGCCWREKVHDTHEKREGRTTMHLECVNTTKGKDCPGDARVIGRGEGVVPQGMSNEECVSKNTGEGLFAQIHFASLPQKRQAT